MNEKGRSLGGEICINAEVGTVESFFCVLDVRSGSGVEPKTIRVQVGMSNQCAMWLNEGVEQW